MEEVRKGGKEERRECGRVKGRKEKERSVKSGSRIKRVICYSLSKKICVESIRNFTSTDRDIFFLALLRRNILNPGICLIGLGRVSGERVWGWIRINSADFVKTPNSGVKERKM